MTERRRPLIVVSGVAFVEGGPLTILREAVAGARTFEGADFRFLVADAGDWEADGHVGFVGFPHARRSYLRRLFTEYVRFPALSRRWGPDAWLSLHDTTPPVRVRRQAVYCQNPLPVWKPTLTDLRLHPFEVVRAKVYGLVYRAFARRNDLVVAQLPWFARFVGALMHVPEDRLLVVTPEPVAVVDGPAGTSSLRGERASLECFYPCLPRVFKNAEEAIDLCDRPGVRLTLTMTGEENAYAAHVRERARGLQVRMAGVLSHADVLATMADADVVIVPSRLETFGLPIQEAMALDRVVVLPVRPWTVEIAAAYPKAHFYRTREEGRAIIEELAAGGTPQGGRPVSVPAAVEQVLGFPGLYERLLA
ncbi:MAG: glycosyltransferase [Actinomycetota bacterium]